MKNTMNKEGVMTIVKLYSKRINQNKVRRKKLNPRKKIKRKIRGDNKE